MSALKPLVAIVGPTASGKTSTAIRLCELFDGELVGVDASQIYRGFDIGTGKADANELGEIPHHNLSFLRPDEDFDAAAFFRRTQSIVEDIRARGKLPVLCGGSGLYFQTLRQGLCRAPKVPASFRETLLKEIDQRGLHAIFEELRDADPETAERLHENDTQRIERALNVYRYTGKRLSEWFRETGFEGLVGDWKIFGLRWAREALRKRISVRVQQMFDAGWVDEVKALVNQGFSAQLRSFSALGYRHVLACIEGQVDISEAQALTILRSTQYAKRQMTWFRRDQDVEWWDCPYEEGRLLSNLELFLEGGTNDHRD